jgi:hypothetical protein
MQKIIAFSILVFMLLQVNYAYSVTITEKSGDNYYSTNEIYSNDLTRVEKYLFGTTYKNNTTQERLNRIEKRLFGKTLNSLNLAQRMNNVLANYKDDYNNKNYLTEYYSSNTPYSRVRNRIIGQPTGLTPPIAPYTVYPQFSRGFSSNRGYGYHNSIPAMTNTGIRILD